MLIFLRTHDVILPEQDLCMPPNQLGQRETLLNNSNFLNTSQFLRMPEVFDWWYLYAPEIRC